MERTESNSAGIVIVEERPYVREVLVGEYADGVQEIFIGGRRATDLEVVAFWTELGERLLPARRAAIRRLAVAMARERIDG